MMGENLSRSLFDNTTNGPVIKNSDLRQLLQETPENFYKHSVDKKLTSFIDSAVGKSNDQRVDSEDKKFLFKLNAAENILKVRNLKNISQM